MVYIFHSFLQWILKHVCNCFGELYMSHVLFRLDDVLYITK